jgi:hypothetical protein
LSPWKLRLCLLGVVLALAIPGAAAELCVEVSVGSVPPPALIFADDFEAGSVVMWENPEPVTEFSATYILDLLFAVSLVGELVGDKVVELEIHTPNGHLYQRLATPVSSAAAAGTVMMVEGYRDPLPVRQLEADGAGDLQFRLPVAGTLIVSNSLYGEWTAWAIVDEQPADCGDPLTFDIVQ